MSSARRLVLVLGGVMLVGGWATTRYVETRQAAIATKTASISSWVGRHGEVAAQTLYARGIIYMAAGAAFVVAGLPAGRLQYMVHNGETQ